jgi:hypothetical protein
MFAFLMTNVRLYTLSAEQFLFSRANVSGFMRVTTFFYFSSSCRAPADLTKLSSLARYLW